MTSCPNCASCEGEKPDSDLPVPYCAVESFLRYVRNGTDVFAIEIANEYLDAGNTIVQILAAERGLNLLVEINRAGGFKVHVSCIVKRGAEVIGDGGDWQVDFNLDWDVISAIPVGRMFID